MQTELIKMWEKALNLIKNELSEISYKTWIEIINPLSWDLDSISLHVPSSFNKGILEARYDGLIRKSIFKLPQRIIQ